MKYQLRRIVILIILISVTIQTWGQNCSCISGTKDKKMGIETIGGVTNTNDYYSLLVQKIMNIKDTAITPLYRLFLNAASKVLLSDSILNTLGTIELKLEDNSRIILKSVKYQNNPLGVCCTLGFWVYVPEETIRILSINPIVTITVNDILSTSFTDKRQKEQIKIYNCLLNKTPK